MAYDLNKLARLQAISDLATRIQNKFNALQAADVSLKGVSVVGNSLKFFTSTDTSTTPAFSIDLPAEMFLDSVSTGLVPNFAFSAATYEGATDPNLNGKPVLVLGVKTRNNDGVSETISYSFLDMSTLVDVYTASDTSIIITDYKVKVNVSADSDNMLATTANGLYVDGSGKVDKVVGTVGNVVTFAADGAVSDTGIPSADVLVKVTGATENNLATYTSDGGISDTGIAIATNTEVSEMLDEILGSSLKSASFASTSDFFSTDPTTFHTFLQEAYNVLPSQYTAKDNMTAITFVVKDSAENEGWAEITYGALNTLLSNSSATINDFATLLTTRMHEQDVDVNLTATYSATNGLTFINESSDAGALVSVKIQEGGQETNEDAGHYILASLYNGASDQTVFSVGEDGNYTVTLESE